MGPKFLTCPRPHKFSRRPWQLCFYNKAKITWSCDTPDWSKASINGMSSFSSPLCLLSTILNILLLICWMPSLNSFSLSLPGSGEPISILCSASWYTFRKASVSRMVTKYHVELSVLQIHMQWIFNWPNTMTSIEIHWKVDTIVKNCYDSIFHKTISLTTSISAAIRAINVMIMNAD